MPGVRTRMKLLVLLLALGACSNRHGNPLELLGETIAPPAPFDLLKLGMTVTEAKAALPELTGELTDVGYAELVVDKVPVRVIFDHSRLTAVMMELERPSFEDELVKRWGPSKTRAPGIVEWYGPTWRAIHSCTPDKTRCGVDFKRPPRPLTAAFFGTVPAPPGVLAKLRANMSVADAKAIAPALVGPFATTGRDLGVDDVEADVQVDLAAGGSGVLQVGITVLTDSGISMLRNAWGPERSMLDHDHPNGRTCWQGDPWRACKLGEEQAPWIIAFERLVPVAKVLGEGPELDYFSGLIGATRVEVEAKYGKLGDPVHCAGCPRLSLPDSDFGKVFLDVHLSEAGKVTTYDLFLDYGGEGDRAALFKRIVAKWDAKPPMPSDIADEKPIVLRPKAPRVTITDIKHDSDRQFMWRISVAP